MHKINLKDLARWALVMPGTGVEFDRPDVRTVRIELNAEMPAAISLVRGDGEVQYLCTASGLTLLEFAEGGRFEIITDAPVWMYSAEFEMLAFTVPDPEVFTTIAKRRARNPELEAMMAIMQQNMDRRFAQMDMENERLRSYAEEQARLASAATAVHSPGASATATDPEVSGQDDGVGQSVGEPEAAAGGTDG